MTGKNKFTTEEIKEIELLLKSKSESYHSSEKKKIRDKLRNEYNFYITDFDNSRRGYGIKNLHHDIDCGLIEIIKTKKDE